MEAEHHKTVYGLGCITSKETRPGHHYLYAEWSINGERACEACGNAADPKSRQKALDKLREATLKRMTLLQRDLDRLRKSLELDAEGSPTGGYSTALP